MAAKMIKTVAALVMTLFLCVIAAPAALASAASAAPTATPVTGSVILCIPFGSATVCF